MIRSLLRTAVTALAIELHQRVVRAAKRALRSLRTRPPGRPESSQPLTHLDAERQRRASHVPEAHKRPRVDPGGESE